MSSITYQEALEALDQLAQVTAEKFGEDDILPRMLRRAGKLLEKRWKNSKNMKTEKPQSECTYTIPWSGSCDRETEPGTDFCENHIDETCTNCDKKATGGCSSTIAGFVCGAPLCDDCGHAHS